MNIATVNPHQAGQNQDSLTALGYRAAGWDGLQHAGKALTVPSRFFASEKLRFTRSRRSGCRVEGESIFDDEEDAAYVILLCLASLFLKDLLADDVDDDDGDGEDDTNSTKISHQQSYSPSLLQEKELKKSERKYKESVHEIG
ncbi:hypothetical protein HC762_00480 [bacterium]|nr:hypothetical protein [bacterium]